MQLRVPLAPRHFRRPIVEVYDDPKQYFFSVFLDNRINTRKDPPPGIANEAAEFFVDAGRGAAGASSLATAHDDGYRFLNRARWRRHLRRERSAKLADQAKVRDGYTCLICGFDFRVVYGDLGVAFAEAHHVVALASVRAKKATCVDDLITVCSNCHRMLHRMPGRPDDVPALRRIVARRTRERGRPSRP